MNNQNTERKFIIFLFLLALALRVGYWLYLQNHYFFFANPGEDVLYYKNWAKAIVFGDPTNNDGTFSGMPLFPYYLAVLYRLTLGNWEAVNFFNLVLGAANCVLVYALAKRLFSSRIAIIASLLAATNFILIYYDWLMMPITLLVSLTLVILIALSGLSVPADREKRNWFLLGVFLGVAALGDGKFLIFTALIAGYWIWQKFNFSIPKVLNAMIPFALGLILVIGGVTVRNKIVGGQWVFITSQSGLSLFVGNNPEATGAYEHPAFMRPSHEGQDLDQKLFVEQTLGHPVSPAQVSDFYRKKAITFITTQPGEYLKLLGRKLALFIGDHEQSQAIDLILQRDYKLKFDWNSYRLIFPLAFLGILVCLLKKKNTASAMLLVAAQLIFSLIYFVTTRHRASIVPVLLIFEAFAFNWLVEKIHFRQYKVVAASLLSIAAFLICTPPRPMDPKTFAFLNYSKAGSVYDAKKDYQQAAQSYRAALTLQPDDANNLYNLGTAYVNLKEYSKAEELFLRALAITDFNVDVLFNLGYVYEQTGETQKALTSYETVLMHAPESLDAQFRIATLYQKQGQCNLANQYFQQILRVKPFLKDEIQKISSSCEIHQ